jgi:RNA polymerase sigma-32 factor
VIPVFQNVLVDDLDKEGSLETLEISLVENGELDAILVCNGDEELESIPIDKFSANTPHDSKGDLLARYFKEANQFALLSPEKERKLIEISKGSDEVEAFEARKKLINCNLRLVIKIASGFHKYWMNNLMDLIQEGNIGLMHALEKFDPEKGVKLSYYASFWIKAYILKFIMRNWKLVKIGTTQAQRKLFYNLKREKEKLVALGFEPSSDLLAEAIGVSPAEVEEMDQRLGGWDLSLDNPLKSGSNERHIDFLPSIDPSCIEILAEVGEKELLHKYLDEFRDGLSKKEISILNLRLLAESPLTLDEIGKIHEISRERIRQIEERLTEKLGNFLNNKSAEEKRKAKLAAEQAKGSKRGSSLSRVIKKNAEDSAEEYVIKWVDLDTSQGVEIIPDREKVNQFRPINKQSEKPISGFRKPYKKLITGASTIGENLPKGGRTMRPKYEKKRGEITPELTLFIEAVRDANFSDEETVRSLLGQISLEAVERELAFEVTVDQLTPFFQALKFKHAFTKPQATCFLVFFGRGTVSAEKIAPYLNVSSANLFAHKKGAVKKLKKYGKKMAVDTGKSEEPFPRSQDAVIAPAKHLAITRLPAPEIDYPDPEHAARSENVSEASCAANCPFAKLMPLIELFIDLAAALKKCSDKLDSAE